VQTFLPYRDFKHSAQCLDRQRLGKQRVEGYQILKVLLGYGKINKNGNMAWSNHPAVKMWKGYEFELVLYIKAICNEWTSRGYKDTVLDKSIDLLSKSCTIRVIKPEWLVNEKLFESHRSNLLRKNKEYYSQFGWTEPDNLPYVWPV